jgi:hypothetical protein
LELSLVVSLCAMVPYAVGNPSWPEWHAAAGAQSADKQTDVRKEIEPVFRTEY